MMGSTANHQLCKGWEILFRPAYRWKIKTQFLFGSF